MIVFGHPFKHFGPRRIHRYAANFPARWVVDGSVTDKGWDHCDLCGAGHRIWLCDDDDWRRLPVKFRKMRMCTRCFRRECR